MGYWGRNTIPNLGASPNDELILRWDKGQGNQRIACMRPETVLLVAFPLRKLILRAYQPIFRLPSCGEQRAAKSKSDQVEE